MPIDYANYPAFWTRLSKHIRFVRANNHCEWCGAENYQPHPVTGSKVVLTVAHLDHDIENSRFSNLAALCNRCHLQYDAKHHAETRRRNREQVTGQLRLWS